MKSNLCDDDDAYILLKGDITVVAAGDAQITKLAFKNCTQFTKCITNIDETTIDDVKDLDLVMLM